jgi:hypothetical protein
MRKTIFFLLSGILLVTNSWAQNDPSVFNSSGGWATYKELTFEWSVGEMATVETFSTDALIVTQGFLQPFNLNIDHVDNLRTGSEKIVVYPDIGKQTCYLETSFEKPGLLNYLLVDLNGRTLLRNETTVNELNSKQFINMQNFPNGFYLLKVSFTNNDETIIKTFKIQK